MESIHLSPKQAAGCLGDNEEKLKFQLLFRKDNDTDEQKRARDSILFEPLSRKSCLFFAVK